MSAIKNVTNEKAIEKIKDLVDGKICLFCTYEGDVIVSRPMSTQAIDDDGTIWFFSKKDSQKNRQINKEDKVYLMYMDSGKEEYLSLEGSAEVVHDRNKVEELWSAFAKAWFPGGKDDPQLTLVKVMPEKGHYWDTKGGKLVSLLSIAVSAITGHQRDGGVEGDITI